MTATSTNATRRLPLPARILTLIAALMIACALASAVSLAQTPPPAEPAPV